MDEKKSTSFAQIFGRLLEHPEQILGVLNLVSAMAGGGQTTSAPTEGFTSTPDSLPETNGNTDIEMPEEPKETQGISPPDEAESMEEQTVPAVAMKSHGHKHRRREMLCAIKPYLHDEKRGRVERILKAAELVDLLKGHDN